MKLVTQTDVISQRLGDEAAVRIICESGFDGIDYSMFDMKNDDCILNTAEYKNHLKKIADMREDRKEYLAGKRLGNLLSSLLNTMV